MKYFPQYKTITGCIFIMLYLLLALPARLWHIHTCTIAITNANTDEEATVVTEAHCDSCTYQTAPYLPAIYAVTAYTVADYGVYADAVYKAAVSFFLYGLHKTRGSPALLPQ